MIDPQDLPDLRLLHLADSALPIGSLAHSFGLETLVSQGILTVDNLESFLRGYLEEVGTLEAVFCRAAFQLSAPGREGFSCSRWIELNERLSALKPARESRSASATLGERFLLLVSGLGDYPLLEEARRAAREAGSLVHHSPAFGLTGGVLELDEDRVVLAYLHHSVSSLVSACQRLLPLGQVLAARTLWSLKPAMVEVAHSSAGCALEGVGCFTPLLDWGASEHPNLPTRLFIS